MKLLMMIPMALLLMSCESNELEAENLNRVEYTFNDSSVPPEYHRSYVVSVTREEIHVVIDSYGDTLVDRAFDSSEEIFKEIVTAIQEAGIQSCEKKEEDCDGGTSEYLACFDNEGGRVISGRVSSCGGRQSGKLCGDVDRVASTIVQAIPDFQSLMEEADDTYYQLFPEDDPR